MDGALIDPVLADKHASVASRVPEPGLISIGIEGKLAGLAARIVDATVAQGIVRT